MKANRADLMRGPKSCWRSPNVSAPCRVCGRYSPVTHTDPCDLARSYCRIHCPSCGGDQALDHERVALTVQDD